MIKASVGEPPVADSPELEKVYCKAIRHFMPKKSCELRKQSTCQTGCKDYIESSREFPLTQLQLDILDMIRRHPKMSNSEIAVEIGCNPSTVYTTRVRKS